jgi:uncharacterized protein
VRRLAVGVVSGLSLCLLACADRPKAVERPRYLGISAEGRARETPDAMRFSLVVRHNADTANAAHVAASAGMANVVAKLKEAGGGAADLQIATAVVFPNMICAWSGAGEDSRRICDQKGFVAKLKLSVLVRDLSKAGALMALGVGAGAEQLTSSDPFFGNPGNAQALARADAVAGAQRRAEQYAAKLGVALGPILAVTDDPLMLPGLHREKAYEPLGSADLGGNIPSVPLEPGQRVVSKTIYVTWELKSGGAE